MFSETKDFWILARVFRGPRVSKALAYVLRGPNFLDPSSCFQRTKGSGSGLMFSEDQGFFGLSLMISEDKRFFGLWLKFLADQKFWILAYVFKGLGFWGFGSCFQRTKGSGSWFMFSAA